MSLKEELTEDEFDFVKHLIMQENTTVNYIMREYSKNLVSEKRLEICESLSNKFEIEYPKFLTDNS